MLPALTSGVDIRRAGALIQRIVARRKHTMCQSTVLDGAGFTGGEDDGEEARWRLEQPGEYGYDELTTQTVRRSELYRELTGSAH
jgi:hypothetical protein